MQSMEIIQRYLGEEVVVYYVNDPSDSGVLVETDGSFVLLERRGKPEILIPITAIRIIEPKRSQKKNNRTLPRAVGDGQGEQHAQTSHADGE